MENNVLDVRGLSVDIGARRAVSSVSFSVGRGECCALVGESGSGKTLTAMAVSGLLPDGIQIGLDGIQINEKLSIVKTQNQSTHLEK